MEVEAARKQILDAATKKWNEGGLAYSSDDVGEDPLSIPKPRKSKKKRLEYTGGPTSAGHVVTPGSGSDSSLNEHIAQSSEAAMERMLQEAQVCQIVQLYQTERTRRAQNRQVDLLEDTRSAQDRHTNLLDRACRALDRQTALSEDTLRAEERKVILLEKIAGALGGGAAPPANAACPTTPAVPAACAARVVGGVAHPAAATTLGEALQDAVQRTKATGLPRRLQLDSLLLEMKALYKRFALDPSTLTMSIAEEALDMPCPGHTQTT